MPIRTVTFALIVHLLLGSAGCRLPSWRFSSFANRNGQASVTRIASLAPTSQPAQSVRPASADRSSDEDAGHDHAISTLHRGSRDDPPTQLVSVATTIASVPPGDQDKFLAEEMSAEDGFSFQTREPAEEIAVPEPYRAVTGEGWHAARSVTPPPVVALTELPEAFQEISLSEVVMVALTDQTVLRSLSGETLRNPASLASILDPQLQSSDAVFGIDAARSQFDPIVTGGASYAKNDDFFNNPSTTGNAAEVKQDLTEWSLGVNKVNQLGTRFSLNHGVTHDSNNNPSVFFPTAWENFWEATIQQPLLQGGGLAFNRIAGPNSRPGFLGTTGIEISRIDNRIEYSRFERGLQDYVLELVNAYWQLDLAYQNYDVIRAARDASRETWQIARARFQNGLPGGEADREAQARSQYYQFELQLDQALNGVQANGTPGVLQSEANLRRLMNMPQSGGDLLRPSDVPSDRVPLYDWDSLSGRAIARRVELRQQRQRVERANLLVTAAKNFTLPRVDVVATYRLSGLGDDLINNEGKFAGALNEVLDTNYEEYDFGLIYERPMGQRQAHAGLRNARLQSARERRVLQELEQQVIHDLGTAYRAVRQAERNIQLAELRRDAARDTYVAREAAYDADAVGFEDLLEAQRFYLDAELSLHNAKTDLERALYRLASEEGSLLLDFQISVHQ